MPTRQVAEFTRATTSPGGIVELPLVVRRAGWAALQLATRSFLATAEAVYRRHRDDPHFDFATAAVEYAKA